MAQANYTPISLYYSTTAAATPSSGNLVSGELAINITDEKLYFKNASGTVKLLASNDSSTGTVSSVAQTFTGGLISVAGSPITTSGTLALTVAGTSGGIPYFSSSSAWASSAALAANSLVVGGGAGAAPASITTGTGVVTALGVNTGTAGAFVVNGGDLGTPSSGTVTNLTGTASININGTVGATTPASGSFTSLTDSGNLTFTGTGNRITGDFTNATQSNRVAFQTSTANSATAITVIPNGTGIQSSINLFNNSDPTNASLLNTLTNTTDARINSTITGTGTYLPMTFYTGGSERFRITTAGGVSFGATGTAYGTAGQALVSAGDAAPVWTTQFLSISFIMDGGGVALMAGVKGDLTIPFGCTITEWTLLADQSGSVVVDIWKDTYANYPPTVADTITGSAKPTITTATKGQSSTLTGWTATINAGDTLRFNVDSATTITRVTLSLKVSRT
jgi:hypothetical protein